MRITSLHYSAIVLSVLLIYGCSKKESPAPPVVVTPVEEKAFTRFEFHRTDNSPVLQDIETEIVADTVYAITFFKTYYTNFENALFSDNFTDSLNGYRKYFDVASYNRPVGTLYFK